MSQKPDHGFQRARARAGKSCRIVFVFVFDCHYTGRTKEGGRKSGQGVRYLTEHPRHSEKREERRKGKKRYIGTHMLCLCYIYDVCICYIYNYATPQGPMIMTRVASLAPSVQSQDGPTALGCERERALREVWL
jgi:hypothetical protein